MLLKTAPLWTTTGTNDVMEGEFTVTDEDAVDTDTELKWSLSGADASKFNISTTGGATRTLSLKEAPDYEAPVDSSRDNLYEVTVVVTDTKGNSDSQGRDGKGHQCRRRRNDYAFDPAAAG